MPGPAPSRHPRRRNARPEWRRLPATGRTGDPPKWPLSEPTDEESELWSQLWASPQAVAWEALGWARMVARYTRFVVKAEHAGSAAALLAEVRQMEDRLGLNPMSMRRLQWEIVAVPETDTPDDVTSLDEYRKRFA